MLANVGWLTLPSSLASSKVIQHSDIFQYTGSGERATLHSCGNGLVGRDTFHHCESWTKNWITHGTCVETIISLKKKNGFRQRTNEPNSIVKLSYNGYSLLFIFYGQRGERRDRKKSYTLRKKKTHEPWERETPPSNIYVATEVIRHWFFHWRLEWYQISLISHRVSFRLHLIEIVARPIRVCLCSVLSVRRRSPITHSSTHSIVSLSTNDNKNGLSTADRKNDMEYRS